MAPTNVGGSGIILVALANNDVYQLFGDDDDFLDGFAVEEGLHLFGSFGGGFKGRVVGVRGNSDDIA